ncbi:MAG: hypothetical protein IPF83_00915 [Rhodanobacteraceae bacterium]|nr:hypothetical protein [Rhodanobacteraceae bacterium]MBK7042979.1 hypothetical protein [Rhodanobacteraceae bacterium]MBP9155299.1 hypothetical protein [Xanthomonadales bacterium]HQW81767.1 hypothetical protein [Pseudomonadota bacterium]
MAGKIDWTRLRASTIVAELLQFSLAVAALALGWLTFPLLLISGAAELVLLVGLSSLFFHERGLLGHALDVLKMLAACAFSAVFLLAIYAGGGGFEQPLLFEWRAVAVLVALVAIRVLAVSISAMRQENRRLHWTREGLLRGGTLFVALFLSVFVCFPLGLLLAALLKMYWPEVAADVAVGGSLLLVQMLLACMMSTMTDAEVAEISQRPYLD